MNQNTHRLAVPVLPKSVVKYLMFGAKALHQKELTVCPTQPKLKVIRHFV